MSGSLFDWKDLARIARSVFTDVPQDIDEIRAWTYCLNFMCVGAYSVVSGIRPILEGNASLQDPVYMSIIDSISELQKVANIFPEEKVKELLRVIWELLDANPMFEVKLLEVER